MKLVDSALVPAYLEPNSQSMQEKAVEVYRARTISQPEQHTNNANAKHKKPQTAPINLCTVNRTLQQTNTNQKNSEACKLWIRGKRKRL